MLGTYLAGLESEGEGEGGADGGFGYVERVEDSCKPPLLMMGDRGEATRPSGYYIVKTRNLGNFSKMSPKSVGFQKLQP